MFASSVWTIAALASLLAVILAFFLLFPRSWGVRRRGGEREAVEDALKQMLDWREAGVTADRGRLGSALDLGLKRLESLVGRMVSHGLIEEKNGVLSLTTDGEHWAAQVMRAHRLWELYLADEARMPIKRVHRAAHHLEHKLTQDQVDALDAHLGHPQTDPHGDPIPSASGAMPAPLGTPLTHWSEGDEARIVHLEDEPPHVYSALVTAGLYPGLRLRLVGMSGDLVKVEIEGTETAFPRSFAENITVAIPEAKVPRVPEGAVRLIDLEDGRQAKVVALDPACRGFTRRRLLDFGLTPGATVRAELRNALGDPRAFRVRGTVVALRREQASQIWVQKSA